MVKPTKQAREEIMKLYEDLEDADLGVEEAEREQRRLRDAIEDFGFNPDKPPKWMAGGKVKHGD